MDVSIRLSDRTIDGADSGLTMRGKPDGAEEIVTRCGGNGDVCENSTDVLISLSHHSTKFKSFKPFCPLMSIHLLIFVIAFNGLGSKVAKICQIRCVHNYLSYYPFSAARGRDVHSTGNVRPRDKVFRPEPTTSKRSIELFRLRNNILQKMSIT